MKTTTVGFIGLGIMGSRMALNLQKNGTDLVVYNRTQSKGAELIKTGAVWAGSPAEVATRADIVITMLATPEAVTAVSNGILGNLAAGKIWIDATTTHPTFVRQIATAAQTAGIRYIDAPVAGSKHQAESAQLVFFAGGTEVDVKEVTPILKQMGQRVVHVGENGMGVSLKVVVNHLLGSSMAAFAEALALGEGLGLPREMLLNSLVGGPVAPPYLVSKKEKLHSQDYSDTEFPLRLMHKDMHMVATAAYDSGVTMPVANLTKEIFHQAVNAGAGEEDFSAISK